MLIVAAATAAAAAACAEKNNKNIAEEKHFHCCAAVAADCFGPISVSISSSIHVQIVVANNSFAIISILWPEASVAL